MNKKFILLWAGEFVSAIGSGLTSFGLGVYVFERTKSAGAMALVTLLAFLPSVILGIPAGVLADRYDRRLLMMLGDGCSAIGLFYILICVCNGNAKLWQICIGVTISSIFSAFLDPAYRATISDIVSPEDYTKASGMVNIAGSSRYIIAPFLAGFILSVWDIRVILIFDICTFVLTVITICYVRKSIEKSTKSEASALEQLKEGFMILKEKKGITVLAIYTAAISLFMGFIQVLSEPMILSYTNSKTLGICETFCAMGMLVSSIFIGIKAIKKNHVKILGISLFTCGIMMVFFGLTESIAFTMASGFVFFLMLPYANTVLDYLLRTNVESKSQGRVWGIVGVISQLGSIISYACCGVIADLVGKTFDVGVGRGAGYSIVAAGVIMALIALCLFLMKSVKALEHVNQ
ncbi:MAG: MFS transporter [Lachnospiraceae bacterium]|nr:MFS transporter [Lachnospiraceae bacterium]